MNALAVAAVLAFGQDPSGKALEVEPAKPDLQGYPKHGLVVFAATPKDLAERARAALERKEAAPLAPSDDVRLYLLFGWSGNGLDDLRATRVEVRFDAKERTFRALIRSTETLDTAGYGGTTDMRYVGFGAKAGRLEAGEYTVKVHELVSTRKTPRDPAPVEHPVKLVRELTFTVR